MKDHYTAYVRQVGRELDVPRRQKKELLRGFRSELEERFPENPSLETLVTDVGKPKEVACTLLESVDPEESRRYRAVKLLRVRCVAIILCFLLAVSIGLICYFDLAKVGRSEVTIIQDPVPTQYSVEVEGE